MVFEIYNLISISVIIFGAWQMMCGGRGDDWYGRIRGGLEMVIIDNRPLLNDAKTVYDFLF